MINANLPKGLAEKALNAYMEASHAGDEICPHCLKTVRQVPRQTPFEAALSVAVSETYHAMEAQRAGRKARCVEKCQHPADFVCDYEDGTSHCLECVAEKMWQIQDIMSGDKDLYRYWAALENIVHPPVTQRDPIEVAREALHPSGGS